MLLGGQLSCPVKCIVRELFNPYVPTAVHLVRHTYKFNGCVKYVRENPLVAGLVMDETAYKWSSANPRIGMEVDEA